MTHDPDAPAPQDTPPGEGRPPEPRPSPPPPDPPFPRPGQDVLPLGEGPDTAARDAR